MSTRSGIHQSNPIGVGAFTVANEGVTSNFVLSAGFGTTRSHIVAPGSTEISGKIEVTSNGTGQAANPTATLTFLTPAFPQAPFCIVARDTTGAQLTVLITVTTTTTQVVFRFNGTPVAGQAYGWHWIIAGGE